MPLYEYECSQCHQRLEKIQSFSAPPEKVCPKCGGELNRVISAPALQFKGAGWYVNDYAKSSGKAAPPATSDSKAETKSDGSSAAGSDGSKSGNDTSSSKTPPSSSTAGTTSQSGGSSKPDSSKPAS